MLRSEGDSASMQNAALSGMNCLRRKATAERPPCRPAAGEWRLVLGALRPAHWPGFELLFSTEESAVPPQVGAVRIQIKMYQPD